VLENDRRSRAKPDMETGLSPGTAGCVTCVLASRLSEDHKTTVLVVEAGKM
jgi:hypothetical protein